MENIEELAKNENQIYVGHFKGSIVMMGAKEASCFLSRSFSYIITGSEIVKGRVGTVEVQFEPIQD